MSFLEFLQVFLQIFVHLYWYIAGIFNFKHPKNIRGNIALITGGAKGIGKSIAFNLAAQGCHIAIVDIDHNKGLKTAAELVSMGVKAKFYKVDVGDLNEMEQLKIKIQRDFGGVDILINNAGIHIAQNVTEEKVDRLMQMLNTNLVSHFWAVRVFLPDMIERRKGHIVAISSMAGLFGTPEAVMYSTTKFGVRGFMEALSMQLFVDGHDDYIKTTTVFPYFIDTQPFIREVVEKGLKIKNKMYTSEECGRAIVDGLLKEKETVTLPEIAYYFTYIL